MKFRRKPVLVEARQFETNQDGGSHLDNLVKWITNNGGSAEHDGVDLFIKTHRGEVKAEVHEWIVYGVNEQFYACDAATFAMTYEQFIQRVNEPPPSVQHILKYFEFEHLPEYLRTVSLPFHQLAVEIAERGLQNPETTVALRKLLEAKDAAIRAGL